jgi:uncharacterized protein
MQEPKSRLQGREPAWVITFYPGVLSDGDVSDLVRFLEACRNSREVHSMTRTGENKRVLERFFAAMSAGDVEAIVNSYAEDGKLHTMGRTLISGVFDRSQIAGAAGRIFEIFPDGIRFTIHTMTAEEDRVAIEAESFGRHVSGQHYNNKYHFLARLRDGKIVSFKEYCDTEHITDVICGGVRRDGGAA